MKALLDKLSGYNPPIDPFLNSAKFKSQSSCPFWGMVLQVRTQNWFIFKILIVLVTKFIGANESALFNIGKLPEGFNCAPDSSFSDDPLPFYQFEYHRFVD